MLTNYRIEVISEKGSTMREYSTKGISTISNNIFEKGMVTFIILSVIFYQVIHNLKMVT